MNIQCFFIISTLILIVQIPLHCASVQQQTTAAIPTPSQIVPDPTQPIPPDIRFYFQDATLETMAHYIEAICNVHFITDDTFTPVTPNSISLKATKITFQSPRPLTKEQAWKLFIQFLDIAKLAMIPTLEKNTYRIPSIQNATQEILPTYFDTDPEHLPNDSMLIRYIFFVKQSPVNTIKKMIDSLVSTTAKTLAYLPLSCIIIVDKSNNIQTLMRIINAFDQNQPEALSVMKLKKIDVAAVEKLYQTLLTTDPEKNINRFFYKEDKTLPPKPLRVIGDPRTNTLVLLGNQKVIDGFEQFISTHIDTDLQMPYTPIHIYELQYVKASVMAKMLNTLIGQQVPRNAGVIQTKDSTPLTLSIIPDDVSNRLIIRGAEKQCQYLQKQIERFDILQPQIALEIIIIDTELTSEKAFGSQLRTKTAKATDNIRLQKTGYPLSASGATAISGASDVILNAKSTITNADGITTLSPDALLGNLMLLAQGNYNGAGSTVMTLTDGKQNIWGILKAIQNVSKANILSNPFLITTNGKTASITISNSRLVRTSNTFLSSAVAYDRIDAGFSLDITPYLNINGDITMEIVFNLSDFDSNSSGSGSKLSKSLKTSAITQNNELLVLGGITKNSIGERVFKVPLLSSIPFIGPLLFKTSIQERISTNLLVFVLPHILDSHNRLDAKKFTQQKLLVSESLMQAGAVDGTSRDPINNLFFDERNQTSHHVVTDFASGQEIGTMHEKKKHQSVIDTISQPQKIKKIRKQRFTNKIA